MVEIFENSELINQPLSCIDFSLFVVNFIGIYRDDKFIFNPSSGTILLPKDRLAIIGYEKTLKELQTYIQTKVIS